MSRRQRRRWQQGRRQPLGGWQAVKLAAANALMLHWHWGALQGRTLRRGGGAGPLARLSAVTDRFPKRLEGPRTP